VIGWEGQLGNFDTTIPFAIQRMLLGNGGDIHDGSVDLDNIQNNRTVAGWGLNTISTTNVNIVRQLSHNIFRQKLIKHFQLNFENNSIVWPRHKKRKIA